jgi:hypothetical protein
MRFVARRLIPVLALIIAVGCAAGLRYADVEGTVTKGGSPLPNVRVEFWPESQGLKSTGVTDAEGRFVLKTEDGSRVGAVVGRHRVVLKDLDMYGDKFYGRKGENVKDLSGGKKPRFGPQYSASEKTPIVKEVAITSKNTLDIEVN